MNISKVKSSCSSFALTAMLASVMGVAGLLAPRPAQAIFCSNCSTIFQDIVEYAKEAMRWGEQGRQWTKEYQQFMQQYNSFLSTIQNMRSSFGLPQGAALEPVAEDFMVAERCGDRYGGGTAGIVGRLTGFSIGDNPQQKRWEYCANLQKMRNRQYNEMVQYLQETMVAMSNDLESAGRQFVGSGRTEGDMNAYSAKLEKVKGDVQHSNDEFQSRMAAYDTYAKAMELNQGSLTRSTMRGGAGIIQKVTNAAVMRQALCGGGKCD